MNPLFAFQNLHLSLASADQITFVYSLIPLAGMGLALAGMITGGINRMQKRRLRHELMRVALEKGQPLPPELLEEKPERRVRDDRRSGLIAIAFAAALYLFLSAVVTAEGVKWVALIPGFIGLALVINWALEIRDAARRDKS